MKIGNLLHKWDFGDSQSSTTVETHQVFVAERKSKRERGSRILRLATEAEAKA